MEDRPGAGPVQAAASDAGAAVVVAGGAEPDDFAPRYLDPERVRLRRSPWGAARLELVDEVCYPRVVVRRIQPLYNADHYIAIWAGDDAEIGIVRDPETLDSESRRILDEELEKRYFMPVIRRIIRVRERFGVHDWDVETEQGPVAFAVQGLHQNVKPVPPARLLVTDVRGNRYDVPDVNALDAHSYAQIKRHV